jgi:hypothetical protein
MIEKGEGREVRKSNIEKVAAFLATSLGALLQNEDELQPADPMLVSLNREDLQVARAFPDASTEVRKRALVVLRDAQAPATPAKPNERATTLVARLAGLGPDVLETFEQLATQFSPKDVSRTKRSRTDTTGPKSRRTAQLR